MANSAGVANALKTRVSYNNNRNNNNWNIYFDDGKFNVRWNGWKWKGGIFKCDRAERVLFAHAIIAMNLNRRNQRIMLVAVVEIFEFDQQVSRCLKIEHFFLSERNDRTGAIYMPLHINDEIWTERFPFFFSFFILLLAFGEAEVHRWGENKNCILYYEVPFYWNNCRLQSL